MKKCEIIAEVLERLDAEGLTLAKEDLAKILSVFGQVFKEWALKPLPGDDGAFPLWGVGIIIRKNGKLHWWLPQEIKHLKPQIAGQSLQSGKGPRRTAKAKRDPVEQESGLDSQSSESWRTDQRESALSLNHKHGAGHGYMAVGAR